MESSRYICTRFSDPAVLAIIYISLVIIVFNWYPFNSIDIDGHFPAVFTVESLELYLASVSIYVFASTLFTLLIPIAYAAKSLGVPDIGRGALYSLAASIIALTLTTIMCLPVYLWPEGDKIVELAFLGLNGSLAYLGILKIIYGGVVFLILLAQIYSSIRAGLSKTGVGVVVGATIFTLIAGVVIRMLGAFIDSQITHSWIVHYYYCTVCPQLYFRGWNPELLNMVLSHAYVIYASAPTVGELFSDIINAFVSGWIVTRLFRFAIQLREVPWRPIDTAQPK